MKCFISLYQYNENYQQETIRAIYSKHSGATSAVNKWIEIIEDNEFKNHNGLKAMFPSADYVGKQRYVFNIKGNHYRFVIMMMFLMDFAEIRFCGTHSEYDKIKDIQNI